MKTVKKTLFYAVVLIAASVLASCGAKMTVTDLSSAENEIAGAENNNAKLSESETVVSYMISCEAGGKTYELGAKNTVSVTGRHTPEMKAYRYNVFNGEEYVDSENFYYADGKALLLRYGERFLSETDGEDFLEYTEESELSLDTDYFSPRRFGQCFVSENKNGKTFTFTDGNEELEKLICDFLGFSELDYVTSVKDLGMTVVILPDGLLKSKSITFGLSYYDEGLPDNVIGYRGDFSYTLAKTEGVEVKESRPTGTEQTIESTEILDLFGGKGLVNLLSSDGLDVTFSKTVTNADSKGAVYILKNEARFTEKTVNGEYRYGSADKRYLKTPGDVESSSTGVFLDAGGFHIRSTDAEANEDKEESPYSEGDLRLIVADTLTGESFYESDIGSLKIKDDGEYYIYTFTLSADMINEYGEYLLSAFASESSYGSFDLSGYGYSIIKNTGTVKVRKSDKATVFQSFSFDCVFGGTLEVSTEYSITVNATGEETEVLTVSDYVTGKEVL